MEVRNPTGLDVAKLLLLCAPKDWLRDFDLSEETKEDFAKIFDLMDLYFQTIHIAEAFYFATKSTKNYTHSKDILRQLYCSPEVMYSLNQITAVERSVSEENLDKQLLSQKKSKIRAKSKDVIYKQKFIEYLFKNSIDLSATATMITCRLIKNKSNHSIHELLSEEDKNSNYFNVKYESGTLNKWVGIAKKLKPRLIEHLRTKLKEQSIEISLEEKKLQNHRESVGMTTSYSMFLKKRQILMDDHFEPKVSLSRLRRDFPFGKYKINGLNDETLNHLITEIDSTK